MRYSAGVGIALKSSWNIKQNLAAGSLVSLLDDYTVGAYTRDEAKVGLQLVYPSRKYLPRQVAGFMDYFVEYMREN